MLPKLFLERIKNQDYIDFNELINSLSGPSPVSIRINPEKWNRIPLHSEPVPWCGEGYYIESRPSYTSDPLFHAGCYYPQEASSMFLGEVFRQVSKDQSNIKILDLCGAPGGKTTLLSSLLKGNGLIVSNEVIRSRASVLAENVTKWGTGNTIVTNNDPSAFARLEGYFDIIVVDAPCSGEGMFRDEIARKEWSEANAAMCSDRQRRILMDVWPALKKGGILIYSTCTFNPVENEVNIKWLTENTDSESIKIETDLKSGIKEISYNGITGYGFYPGNIKGDGFFLSVVRKKGESKAPGIRKIKGSSSASTSDIRTAEKLISGNIDNIYRHDDTVYRLALPPEEYLHLIKTLRIIKGGTALFKVRNSDISPIHDLAVSSMINSEAFVKYDMDYNQALSFLRRENFILNNQETGWILISYLGLNLGFVKNVGARINNYFPVEWRIRLNKESISQERILKWKGVLSD